MKIKLLFLFLFSISIHAQIVNIPDVNFKQRLLSANNNNSSIAGILSPDGTYYTLGATIDTNHNGEIEITEAQQIDFLDVSGYNGYSASIYDLTGIEAFSNLKFLNFSNNNISTFNVSTLSQLTSLVCDGNGMTSVNLANFPNLTGFRCYNNLLTSLDFSGLNNLQSVNCGDNKVTTLDFHNNPLFYDLGCGNNPFLSTIILKNGAVQNCFWGFQQCDGFINCPNLTHICADDNEVNAVQSLAAQFGNSSVLVDSDCNFLPVDSFDLNESILIYPNPTRTIINVKSINNIQSIELYDVQGRLLLERVSNQINEMIDLTSKSDGVYFIKIATEKGMKVQKIVKE